MSNQPANAAQLLKNGKMNKNEGVVAGLANVDCQRKAEARQARIRKLLNMVSLL